MEVHNPCNTLITETDVVTLFEQYGLKWKPRNMGLYITAFTHKSYCTSKPPIPPTDCVSLQKESFERLEFLGDSILGMIVASYLYERYPGENEGFMTKIRTKLINGVKLAEFARILNFDKYILLSAQHESIRSSTRCMDDVFEAFLGAMYIDFNAIRIKNDKLNGFGIGLQAVQVWLVNFIEENVDFTDLINTEDNFKEALHKKMMLFNGVPPRFVEKKERDRGLITVVVMKNNDVLATCSKITRKEAEQGAAKLALEQFGVNAFANVQSRFS